MVNNNNMSTQVWKPTFESCDTYMSERTGKYEYRAIRYRKAADWLMNNGLTDQHTICDIGAGWTEFDYCLRKEYDWKGRYIPIDGGINNIDLNVWEPEREINFYVALEILEHLHNPSRIIKELQQTSQGIFVSVPDPTKVNIFELDPTHVTDEITEKFLQTHGFTVTSDKIYGGVFSNGNNDALIANWLKN